MAMHGMEYARRVQARRGQLYRLAYCYVKNQQDALDIVSEAVYRGLLRLHQLRKGDSFDAWMNRIVVNAALDHLRKGSTRWESREELPPELPAEEQTLTPEETMDLYGALDFLPPEERTYLILRFFEECSYREMAEILELPESTIKSRLYRILEKLRRQLTTGEEEHHGASSKPTAIL